MDYLGPGIWYILHQQALATPWSNKDQYYKFVQNIIDSLPCDKCRQDALTYLEKNAISDLFNKKDGLFYWSVRFHNYVNLKLGKPQRGLDIIAEYKNTEHTCNSCTINLDEI